MTSFPARPLRSSVYVEVIRRVAADGVLYGCRGKTTKCKLAGFLKTLEYWPRDKFWDLVSGCLILCLEMLDTIVLCLGQDLGLITALGVWLGVKDVFTQIAKDVAGRGLDHEVDLANDREEGVPFNVLDATFIIEFSSSQMFSMLFRDSLGSAETERNALMLEDFS
ncbi:hypothetical protein YC2023_076980 [Brassica napus]